MFPRSAGPDPSRSATFREAASRLPRDRRPGLRRRLPAASPSDRDELSKGTEQPPASPDPATRAARGRSGRPKAVIRRSNPGSGRLTTSTAFRAEAERLGLEVALDLAWQSSPDHPWVSEHPEWFRHRPDGTIKYAENPPKKYQDIYPLDFESDDWRGPVAGAARGDALLDRPGRADLPRRQSPHEDLAVLGMAHRPGALSRPARHLPRGGVHAPAA